MNVDPDKPGLPKIYILSWEAVAKALAYNSTVFFIYPSVTVMGFVITCSRIFIAVASYTHTRMHARMDARKPACMHAHMHARTHAHTHTHTHAHTHTHTHTQHTHTHTSEDDIVFVLGR